MSAVTVKFPLPPDEHRALKARAALSGLTLREFCRRLALSAVRAEPSAQHPAPAVNQPREADATTK